jgi:anti-sigma B factor antagonist
MDIEVTDANGEARVTLRGHVDENGAEALKNRMADVRERGYKRLTFDFKDVTRIGSAGIGQLLLVYKNMALREGDIRIVNVSPAIDELFRGLKLDTLFQIYRA